MDPSSLAILLERRRRLAEALGDLPALIFAGAPLSRNFPANRYPFRASSHFLYFVGASLPEAALLIDEGKALLFDREPPEGDALWHGEQDSPQAVAEALGCEHRPFSGLGDAIGGRRVASLAAADAVTRSLQIALLGREPGRSADGDASTEDERLMEAIVSLRLRHDALAIEGLRRAAGVTTAAHKAGLVATRSAQHERDIRAAMEAELTRAGCEPAYGSIVTTHGEVLHQQHSLNALEPNALLLADVGAEVREGYCGDVTRTWPVSGRFTGSQRAIYEVVLKAQHDAIALVRPGVRFRDVHLAACRSLTEGLVALGLLRGDVEELVADGVHALFFPHGVGHLLGLDVHDMEDLGDRAGYGPGRERSTAPGLRYLRLDRDLEAGMAVTIEPGFYRIEALLGSELADRAGDRLVRARLQDFADVRGIRIEDDLLITESGSETLSASIPKSVEAIEEAL